MSRKDYSPLLGFALAVLITVAVALLLAALLNLAVSKVGSRRAMSWPRLAIIVTMATLLLWVIVAVVAIVSATLDAAGFTGPRMLDHVVSIAEQAEFCAGLDVQQAPSLLIASRQRCDLVTGGDARLA